MSDIIGIIANHSNGYYEKVLKNDFGYKLTVYDEFNRDAVLNMLHYIDDMTTSEINTNDSKILNDLNNIAKSNKVTQQHIEQLLKVLEWDNVNSDLWYSKRNDEEQKSKEKALKEIKNTPEKNRLYVKDTNKND